jgi:hypothetical protein
MFGAEVAIANQGRAVYGLASLDGPGETLPRIYQAAGSDFRDITVGNNGYPAMAGYDLVTGRGSPVGGAMIRDLVGATAPYVGSLVSSVAGAQVNDVVTLTASGVASPLGVITGVSFYMETNGVAGLEAGSDVLLGTVSGAGPVFNWTTGVSATPGTDVFYAVATDSTGAVSAGTSVSVGVTYPTPVIGAFSLSSATVAYGGTTTLTASNVSERGSTPTSVTFYLEGNGTEGLQTGSGGDTVAGSGSASGSTWTSVFSTGGTPVGTYTLYAVAADDVYGTRSAVLVQTLKVTGGTLTSGVLAGWDVSKQANYGSQGLKANTLSSALVNTTGLTRASALSNSGSVASGAWGARNWYTGTSSSIPFTNNQYVWFGFTVASGVVVSFSTLDLRYTRNTAGPTNGIWQYQVNGGTWTTLLNQWNEFPSTDGAQMATLQLSDAAGLQGLSGGTVVNFRLAAYVASSSTGTWFIANNPAVVGDDLVISGTVSTAPAVTSRAVAGGATQRSMVQTINYTFNTPVYVPGDAFTLARRGDGAVYSLLVSNPSNDAQTYVLTVGSSAGVVGGSLPDGVYDLTPNLSKIRDGYGRTVPTGSALSGVFAFHRLFGDSNGDKKVDSVDTAAFNAVYATSLARAGSGFAWWADYDGNGAVNNTDLLQYRKRVGVAYVYA